MSSQLVDGSKIIDVSEDESYLSFQNEFLNWSVDKDAGIIFNMTYLNGTGVNMTPAETGYFTALYQEGPINQWIFEDTETDDTCNNEITDVRVTTYCLSDDTNPASVNSTFTISWKFYNDMAHWNTNITKVDHFAGEDKTNSHRYRFGYYIGGYKYTNVSNGTDIVSYPIDNPGGHRSFYDGEGKGSQGSNSKGMISLNDSTDTTEIFEIIWDETTYNEMNMTYFYTQDQIGQAGYDIIEFGRIESSTPSLNQNISLWSGFRYTGNISANVTYDRLIGNPPSVTNYDSTSSVVDGYETRIHSNTTKNFNISINRGDTRNDIFFVESSLVSNLSSPYYYFIYNTTEGSINESHLWIFFNSSDGIHFDKWLNTSDGNLSLNTTDDVFGLANRTDMYYSNRTNLHSVILQYDLGASDLRVFGSPISLGKFGEPANLGTLSSSLSSYSYSDNVGQSEVFNSTLSHNGNVNTIINLSINGNIEKESLANNSMFIFNWTFNGTDGNTISTGEKNEIQINITAYANVSTGTYRGNFSINRTNDNTITNITLTATITGSFADVKINESSWAISSTSGSGTQALYLYNDGNRDASNCNLSLSSTYGGTDTYNISNFDLTTTENTTALMTLTGDGSDDNPTIELECIATADGGKDTDLVSGSISITTSSSTPSGGGGGGGPTTQPINFILFPTGRPIIPGIDIRIDSCIGINSTTKYDISIRNDDVSSFLPRFDMTAGLRGIMSADWDGGRIFPAETRKFILTAKSPPDSVIGTIYNGTFWVQAEQSTKPIFVNLKVQQACFSGIPFLDKLLTNFQKPLIVQESDKEGIDPLIISWGMGMLAVGIISFIRYPNRKLITLVFLIIILFFIP